jgi:hypothetical protein
VACGSGDSNNTVDYSKVELAINELQASNQSTAYDEANEADDWFEVYNPSKTKQALTSFYVSDDPSNPTKYQMPEGVTVPAGGVVIIWADGTPAQGSNHLPFKLSAAGESVLISDPTGALLDTVDYVTAPGAGQSFARHPDGTGTFQWCATPTPGALNSDVCAAAPVP